MENARYHPSIAKYTYRIEYVEKLPSKKNYVDARESAMAGFQYGKARFVNDLINVRVLKDGSHRILVTMSLGWGPEAIPSPLSYLHCVMCAHIVLHVLRVRFVRVTCVTCAICVVHTVLHVRTLCYMCYMCGL